MNKKTEQLAIVFIIILLFFLLTCDFLKRPMKLKLPDTLDDGSATESSGEGYIEIYDYKDTDLLVELEVVPADEDDTDNNNNDTDDLKKILIIPPFLEIPANELSVEFTCTAYDTDMGAYDSKDITVRASALHHRDAEDTLTVFDTTPEPTPEPTETPVPSPESSPGAVWLDPVEQTVTIGEDFTTEVHCNTGDQRLGTYGIDFFYTFSIINVDIEEGMNGVTVGPDGFVSAVNSNVDGEIKTTGFDASGTNPGDDLHIFTIHWTAVAGPTTTQIEIDVNTLTDENTNVIGVPTGIDGTVIIEEN